MICTQNKAIMPPQRRRRPRRVVPPLYHGGTVSSRGEQRRIFPDFYYPISDVCGK